MPCGPEGKRHLHGSLGPDGANNDEQVHGGEMGEKENWNGSCALVRGCSKEGRM